MRGDIARLGRCTTICTQGEDTIWRSKPFKYAYEKEIVLYVSPPMIATIIMRSSFLPQLRLSVFRVLTSMLQETRLLLDRVHILARRVSWPFMRIPEGPRIGAAQRDRRHHPLRRGVRGKGRGSCDAEDSAYVPLIAHFLPHRHN
jgi:hypothetical protein